eukprot:TRINITY_DN42874_c0_g1_i2.p1 TRINITY_DN42874_c0_g1~~TRINITY_DN42874_c0_g1_i2.p1  ORF type:complete len:139 (+),score=6.68 TRINITY_DN42874_c0_g1_i2:41-457(+)
MVDSWKFKAFTAARDARNLMSNVKKGGSVNKMVKYYMYGSSLILLILGVLALIFKEFGAGPIAMLIAVGIISLEAVEQFIPKVASFLDFFYETYYWRALVYFILAIPTFISLFTFFGGILQIAGSIAYAYCAWKGAGQ